MSQKCQTRAVSNPPKIAPTRAAADFQAWPGQILTGIKRDETWDRYELPYQEPLRILIARTYSPRLLNASRTSSRRY
jgi:hypothetical protein